MVKHPSVNKVSYRSLVGEIWKSHLSDDGEEDKLLKKTIVNTNHGTLEEQVNKTQKSKLFGNYKEARFFQVKRGGPTNFIQWVSRDH